MVIRALAGRVRQLAEGHEQRAGIRENCARRAVLEQRVRLKPNLHNASLTSRRL